MVKHSHVLVNCLEFQSRTELYYVVLCCTVVALHFTGMCCVCYCTVLLHHYHVDGYAGYVCFVKGLSLILYNKEIAFLVSNSTIQYHVFCCSDLYSIKFYCSLIQDRMVTNTAVTNEMINTIARNKYVAYEVLPQSTHLQEGKDICLIRFSGFFRNAFENTSCITMLAEAEGKKS